MFTLAPSCIAAASHVQVETFTVIMINSSSSSNPESHDVIQRLDQIRLCLVDAMYTPDLDKVYIKNVSVDVKLLAEAKQLMFLHCSEKVIRLWCDVVCESCSTQEPEWQFLSVLVWEALLPHHSWMMKSSSSKWDAFVLDIMNRFFPYQTM